MLLHQNKCCLDFTDEALTSLQGISPAKASIKIGRGETWDEVADPYRELNHSEDGNMGFANKAIGNRSLLSDVILPPVQK